MSGFTPTVKFELDYDSDHLVFELRRLKVKHRALIMRTFEQGQGAGERDAILAENGLKILPDCVLSISGLVVGGKPITEIKDILEEAYFLTLVDKLLAQLIRISRPQGEDVKNSEGLPVVISKV